MTCSMRYRNLCFECGIPFLTDNESEIECEGCTLMKLEPGTIIPVETKNVVINKSGGIQRRQGISDSWPIAMSNDAADTGWCEACGKPERPNQSNVYFDRDCTWVCLECYHFEKHGTGTLRPSPGTKKDDAVKEKLIPRLSSQHVCTCTMHVLMVSGCQCGGT